MEESRHEDGLPLLPVSNDFDHELSTLDVLRSKQRAREEAEIQNVGDIVLAERGYSDEIDGELLLEASAKQRRKTVLVVTDATVMILEYLQFYALVMSLALRWPWPATWLESTWFLFVFNIDIWEMVKMSKSGVYSSARDGFIDSTLIGFDYRFILLGWGLFAVIFVSVFIGMLISMTYQRRFNLLSGIANLKRVYIFVTQLILLPIGVAFGKVFHCNDDNNMDVHNGIPCGSGEQIAYMCIAAIMFFGFFFLLPIWMAMKIKHQVFCHRSQSDRHEGYLQLKEAEYIHSLDLIWALNQYHLFSSYNRFWVYYKPVMFFVKFIFILSYALMLQYPVWQMVVFVTPITLLLIVVLIKWPFRVVSFNPQLFITLLCMLILSTLGVVQNAETTDSVFFQPTYLSSELLSVTLLWLIFSILWLLFILFRLYGIFCKSKPLWPAMNGRRFNKLSESTQKYMRALLCGRIVLMQALTSSKLFSPCHEVTRQIHIINAYCRETEYLRDPIHDALWDLLDELIEAHSRISPHSLFAESNKQSIRETAKQLMRLLPAFKQRLTQREYDFCLMTPMKRRMLLKMYCLGVFVNGRDVSRQKITLQDDIVQKLYDPMTSVVLKTRQVEGDDGIYDDPVEDGERDQYMPTSQRKRQQLQDVGLILTSILEDEQESAEDEESSGYLRTLTAASSDMVSSIDDQDMDDINELMMNVPSRSQTAMGSNSFSGTTSLKSWHSRPMSTVSKRGNSLEEIESRSPSVQSKTEDPLDMLYSRPASAQSTKGDLFGTVNSRPTSAHSKTGKHVGMASSRPSSALSKNLDQTDSRPLSAQSNSNLVDQTSSRPSSAQSRSGQTKTLHQD